MYNIYGKLLPCDQLLQRRLKHNITENEVKLGLLDGGYSMDKKATGLT